ncbi:MAG TPA: nuclear transport factor 2 family protein [Chitinophagaceae bacterium]|jgi:ketosteroid isomerase-like protein|nr:nuclear transport factor 2 family protein [Chitinophagaceae bacterium]
MKKSATIVVLFISLLLAIGADAQTSHKPASKELYDKLAELDSALFSIVYTCNPDKVQSFFTEDLEFYHDKGGLTKSRKVFTEQLKSNFCGEKNWKLRRKLVKGSLRVCAINNYGAIQIGEHRFYITENGQPEKQSGVAKFAHIWKRENGEWKISRILSYDHKEPDSKIPTVSKELYDTIAHLDSMLFKAFNAHDLGKLMAGFTNDLEFYHDKDGLINYTQTSEGFRKMFAQNNGIKRELVKGSLEVYPIQNFGAIEVGSHQFCHIENGKQDCGTFPFIMIWQRTTAGWKISRVISYNH